MALRLLGLLVSLFFAEMVSAAPTNTVDGIYATSTPLCPATGPNNNGTIWVGANGYHYMIACDRMYVGGDLAAPTGHTDLSTCLAACENYANRACVAATFDAEAGGVNVPNAAGTCHLKSYAFTPLIADTKKDGAFCIDCPDPSRTSCTPTAQSPVTCPTTSPGGNFAHRPSCLTHDYQVHCRTVFSGQPVNGMSSQILQVEDLAPLQGWTFETCQRLCDVTAECVGGTWNHFYKRCNLRRNIINQAASGTSGGDSDWGFLKGALQPAGVAAAPSPTTTTTTTTTPSPTKTTTTTTTAPDTTTTTTTPSPTTTDPPAGSVVYITITSTAPGATVIQTQVVTTAGSVEYVTVTSTLPGSTYVTTVSCPQFLLSVPSL